MFARAARLLSTRVTSRPSVLNNNSITGYRGAIASFKMAPQQSRKQSALPAGYKEDPNAGPMLRFESSLPPLPVPKLEETADRYLKSLRALLNEKEYKHSKEVVQEFIKPNGLGQTLQKRLEQKAAEPGMKNWLTEWWNDAAYLTYKDPIVPYVSYFYSHRDDRKRRDPAKRAAAISYAVLDFKKQVDEESLPIESMKGLPIAMSSYKYMFNCCRLPDHKADYPKKYDYKQHPYILVIRNGSFYKLDHEVDGVQLTCAELESQFRRIYETAENGPGVGICTTENRDTWADIRNRLIQSNPANEAALETIQAASFVVSLDSAAPITLKERALQYWCGGQGGSSSTNRWYDKPVELIICDNGKSGFNGEHSMMDGTPTHRLNDYINMKIFGNQLDFDNPTVRSNLPPPSPIRFELSEENLSDIGQAQINHAKLMSQHELVVEAFQGYGKGLIKKFKCSPDSYVQMLIQLAYHKQFGRSRPTYESAATRRFAEGRTETCRSVSEESVAWCNAMADPASTEEERRSLFRAATSSHGKFIQDASAGHGVDRHLFGLKKCLKDGESAAIFKDPAFSYSSSWFVSSSQLSSEFFNGYGWSQVIDDGFGCAYMINENSLAFNIVSKKRGSERFAFHLNEAACEMRDLLMPEVQIAPKL